jgi:hypothetical protein
VLRWVVTGHQDTRLATDMALPQLLRLPHPFMLHPQHGLTSIWPEPLSGPDPGCLADPSTPTCHPLLLLTLLLLPGVRASWQRWWLVRASKPSGRAGRSAKAG